MADPRFFARAGPFTLAELARLSGAKLLASGYRASGSCHDVAPLETAGPDEVSFLDNRKYLGAVPYFARRRGLRRRMGGRARAARHGAAGERRAL